MNIFNEIFSRKNFKSFILQSSLVYVFVSSFLVSLTSYTLSTGFSTNQNIQNFYFIIFVVSFVLFYFFYNFFVIPLLHGYFGYEAVQAGLENRDFDFFHIKKNLLITNIKKSLKFILQDTIYSLLSMIILLPIFIVMYILFVAYLNNGVNLLDPNYNPSANILFLSGIIFTVIVLLFSMFFTLIVSKTAMILMISTNTFSYAFKIKLLFDTLKTNLRSISTIFIKTILLGSLLIVMFIITFFIYLLILEMVFSANSSMSIFLAVITYTVFTLTFAIFMAFINVTVNFYIGRSFREKVKIRMF